MTLWQILILIFLIVVFASFYVLFFKDGGVIKLRGKNKNMSDSKSVHDALSIAQKFVNAKGGKVITPAKLAINGKFADFDFIIVGFYGVTAVKCVGLGGEIYGTAQEEEWLHILNGERKNIPNPLASLDAQARVVRDALFAAKLKNISVEAVCVFTNNKTNLAINRNAGHLTTKTFKTAMNKDKYLQDKKVDVEKTCEAINEYIVKE